MLFVIAYTLLFSISSILAQQTFSGTNNIPDVTLLIDNRGFNQTRTIKALLAAVSAKKGRTFHFGVAYDAGNASIDSFASAKLNDTFNHGVAENNCKWQFTEPSRNVSDLSACKKSQAFFTNNGASFRLHNTFWHQQTPSWLPSTFSASALLEDIIPTHVRQEAGGMTGYTSVDVLNEIVGDSTTTNMSAYECVANKQVWPTTVNDTNTTPLLTDLKFVQVALQAAAQSTNATLVLNDYSTGGNNSKTACYYKLAQNLQQNNVPLGGVGFQSHVGAKSNNFDSKEDLKQTFAQFGALGLDVLITEFDVWLQDASNQSERWQAAIYGDYLDACLYSDNCHDFIVWGLYDAVSWLNTFPGRGVSMPLLFDAQGRAKPNYYEVIARLERFVAGTGEVCASAAGKAACDLTLSQYQVNASSPRMTTSTAARASGSASASVVPRQSATTRSSTTGSNDPIPSSVTSGQGRLVSSCVALVLAVLTSALML